MLRHTKCGGIVRIVNGVAICSLCKKAVRAQVSSK